MMEEGVDLIKISSPGWVSLRAFNNSLLLWIYKLIKHSFNSYRTIYICHTTWSHFHSHHLNQIYLESIKSLENNSGKVWIILLTASRKARFIILKNQLIVWVDWLILLHVSDARFCGSFTDDLAECLGNAVRGANEVLRSSERRNSLMWTSTDQTKRQKPFQSILRSSDVEDIRKKIKKKKTEMNYNK